MVNFGQFQYVLSKIVAMGDELHTLFHPIVNATKQAAEEIRKELEPRKKLVAEASAGPRVKNVGNTFGMYRRKDGQLQVGNKIVKISEDGTTLKVDDAAYELIPGLHTLIIQKHPRPNQWTSNDYQAY